MDEIATQILDQEHAAQCFAALGSEQRLAVLQALVAAGPDGMSAGTLAARVGLGASTLTHHLRFLSQAGLVRQRREGRRILSSADFDQVTRLSHYLLLNCCAEAATHHKDYARD